MSWQPISTAPWDRYVLLCDRSEPRWNGNMEVGKWFGENEPTACFWSSGGPNGGLEYGYNQFTHWMDLPEDPE